jgi:hypothetical protein
MLPVVLTSANQGIRKPACAPVETFALQHPVVVQKSRVLADPLWGAKPDDVWISQLQEPLLDAINVIRSVRGAIAD